VGLCILPVPGRLEEANAGEIAVEIAYSFFFFFHSFFAAVAGNGLGLLRGAHVTTCIAREIAKLLAEKAWEFSFPVKFSGGGW